MNAPEHRFRARCLAVGGVLALLASGDAGCSSDSTQAPSGCPQDLPAACPTPTPSFKSDVQPIFERRCWMCHTGDGIAAAAHDFSTYDRIFAQRTSVLTQVYACNMPPSDGTPLTTDERRTLLSWLVCKAPNN